MFLSDRKKKIQTKQKLIKYFKLYFIIPNHKLHKYHKNNYTVWLIQKVLETHLAL